MSQTFSPLYGVFDVASGALQGVCPVSGTVSSISGNPVSITGTNTVGSVLTAALATGWSATGFQWTRDGSNISGATSATYTLVSADSSHTVGVVVTGLVYAPTGVAVAAAAAVAPVITGAPVLNAVVSGGTVTWTAGTMTGNPTPTATYALKKNGSIVSSSATSGSYSTITAGDIFIVTQSATNTAGSATPVDSSAVTATSGTALRYASASNFIATAAQTYNLATGNAALDVLQNQSHIIGQDVTSISLGTTLQWVKASVGISNLGNSLTIAEMAVVYNGAVVAVTSGGLSTWTITDTSNWQSDALACTSFASATKFAKGTWLQIRVRFRSTAPTTDKFPVGATMRAGVDTALYMDPAKQTITTGVMATGVFAYTNKSFAITSATASGTVVTATMADTSQLVTATKYTISGATGTGSALQYNATSVVITVVNSTTVTYDVSTVGGTAPAATATGSLVFAGKNGVDANFGSSSVPFYVLANHSSPAVVFFGDSKTHGTGDAAPASALIGMSRCMVSNPADITTVVCSGINMGCPSGYALEMYTATASGVVANHEHWYTLANHAVVGYGTNNASTANQASLWARIRANGITPIVQRSLTPRTTCTTPVTAISGNGTTVTLTVSSTFITNLGLTVGQTFSGFVTGFTPTGYNTVANVIQGNTMTVASATTLTYANTTSATATVLGTVTDQWMTQANQTTVAGWSNGGTADTFEAYCRTAVASDANMTFYQSTGERNNATVGSAGYWMWVTNGVSDYATYDGLHEGGTNPGYELNIRTGGTITTQAGGTVSGTLASLVAAFT